MLALAPDAPEEDRRQVALLRLPLGGKGSGMTRYAAAMHFHRAGLISADLLEAYRICCKLDDEDPEALADRLAGRA